MNLASVTLCVAALLVVVQISAEERNWQSLGSYRAAPLNVTVEGKAGFTLLNGRETGVQFANQLSIERSLTNQIFLNGSGVAAGDVDGDGWCDLYFCGLDNQNELYRNLGNWKFERITDLAGVGCADQASTGAALADMDGDGDLDLLVNGIARGTRFFANDGRARFEEFTESAGLGGRTGSMSLAIADVNGDGQLDIYVVNYRSGTYRDEPEKRFRVLTRGGKYEINLVDGRPTTEPDLVGRFTADPVFGLMEHGEPDVLYLNESGGRFRRVNWGDGTFLDESGKPFPIPYDWGLSAMFRDLNGDGSPDLYVCNDFQSPDRIWLNNGRGTFRRATMNSLRQTSLFSMGVDFADLDGDGREEIFVADMLSRKHERRQMQVMDGTAGNVPNRKLESRPQVSRNTLFWNRGDGSYAEIAQLSGIAATEWSWCPVFLDVDLDGRRDLLVTAGHERDAQHIDVAREIDQAKRQKAPWRQQMEMRRKFPRLESPILAFRNRGELDFGETSAEWGFTTAQVAHGLALADLDNDGDLDLIANGLNTSALVYRNETPTPRVAVRLRGNAPNTHGIGAKISVRCDRFSSQTEQVIAAGRYLSSDDFVKTFAVGSGSNITIHVAWPTGKESTVTNANANRIYEISEASAVPQSPRIKSIPPAIFEDVSSALNHPHHDEPFDDFQRQILLPRKFSELGPALSWFDVDGDGWEDLVVGSGRGGKLAYFNNNAGKLAARPLSELGSPATRDHAGILGWFQKTNRTLLVAVSNYEDGRTNSAILQEVDVGGKSSKNLLDGQESSAGALALGDADGDGDLDLFVAGRVIPARYPEPAPSTFLRNDVGVLKPDLSLSQAFKELGLVSSAMWSDLNGDGRPELLLAIDGGTLRVFTFSEERFKEATTDLGLQQWSGWWQGVTTGDFNNDGRMDIVAGNLGRNSKYQSFMPDRYHLYYGNFAKDGTVQIVEAHLDPELKKIVPMMDRDSLALGLPDLKQRYPTFASFSRASVSEFLGPRMNEAREIRINTTDSMLFLSDENGFRAVPLPLPVQFSPVFGLAVGDVDADGNEDLIVSQNLFSVGKDTSRYDAGEGLLLLGDGKGGLSPVPASTSGFKIKGEGRGLALCDFDHDGRLDFAAGQNSDLTKLYRNGSPTSGIRISVQGGERNPQGIGAAVRLRYGDNSYGPRHEIRAGEGYWSQASSTIVLGKKTTADQVEIVWPGGKRETIAIPAGAKEVVIRSKN